MTPDQSQDEDALFALLDRYVALLHAGEQSSADAMLAARPELARWTDCLNALDEFVLAETLIVGPTATDETAAPVANDPCEFGRYRLLEEIGRGGMGVVYKARQAELDRLVAVKMILSSQFAGADDVKRFYREARAAGQLRHPHIVGIYEVGQVYGQHYFAMEYIAGQSLAALLKAGPLPPERAARMLLAVAQAVDFLHRHGILHRDLKPSNILVNDAGQPFVTDFGLAKLFQDDDERTQSGAILGTPAYMSPEQAGGRISEISARSDVYSLGAVLYEMLCGQPVFQNENPLNTLLQVLEGEPLRPRLVDRAIPIELERICLRCLEKSPDRRYASAADLADDLDRYLLREPLATPSTRLRDRLRRWARRETGLVARLAILAATAGIVQWQHLQSGRDWSYHRDIKVVFVLWAALAVVLQRLFHHERTAELARLAWAVADPLLLLVVLRLAGDDYAPLLIGYPLLVVASGLWFRTRLVVVSTAASLVSFACLQYGRSRPATQPHYPIIFATALFIIGGIVAYQVYRLRTLNRYFEQTRPPR